MKRYSAAALFAAVLLAGAGAAFAGEKTVKLSVAMWCAACPYMVQRSLERVEGVVEVAVSYDDQSATVIFDDDKTDVAALTTATADIGFPSELLATN